MLEYVLWNYFCCPATFSKTSSKITKQNSRFNSQYTCFSWYLQKGIDATLAVVAFRGQCGNIVPAHGLDNVHHGLCLVRVRRHHTGEELIAAFVTQLGGSGGVANLWDLKREDRSAAVEMSGQVGKKKTSVALDIRTAKKVKKREVVLQPAHVPLPQSERKANALTLIPMKTDTTAVWSILKDVYKKKGKKNIQKKVK